MRVSVVIPAYNAQSYVGHAVASALAQRGDLDLEVVVVDDGSTDGTAAALSSITDRRVRVVSQPNRGVAAARNEGLRQTTGPYVAFLDADDDWLPHKLEVQIAHLAAHDRMVAVGSLMAYVSATGRVLGTAGEALTPESHAELAAGRLMPFPLSSVLFRREPLEAVGGFDESLAVDIPGLVEDLDILSRLAVVGPIGCLAEVLGGYRMHGSSASVRHYLSQRDGIRYVTARRSAEAAGTTLTWREFKAGHPPSATERLGDHAAWYYRRAGLSAADRRWVPAVAYGLGASLLRPRYVYRRLRRQRPWGR